MEAMFGLDDLQTSPLKLLAILPSLKVPLAMNLSNVPCAIRGLEGEMVIETSWAVVTVRPVEPLTEPEAAVMVVVPAAMLVATPWLLTVATAGLDELQRTDAVMS